MTCIYRLVIVCLCICLYVTSITVPVWAVPHEAFLTDFFSTHINELTQLNEQSTGSPIIYNPNATPLMVISPELSVWSMSENPYDDVTRHWSGINMTLNVAASIDGVVYRLLGQSNYFPQSLPLTSRIITATNTYLIYTLADVQITLIFINPSDQLDNISELARPYAYFIATVNITNVQASHHVKLLVEQGSDWALDQQHDDSSLIQWSQVQTTTFTSNIIQLYDQLPFNLKGDYIKQNWGRSFMTAPADERMTSAIDISDTIQLAFLQNQPLPGVSQQQPRTWIGNGSQIVSAMQWDFGVCTNQSTQVMWGLMGIDDIASMLYFQEVQIPYWRHQFNHDFNALNQDAINAFPIILQRNTQWNTQLLLQLIETCQRSALTSLSYVSITTLGYRQVTGSLKITYSEVFNSSRVYMKEISTDGDVSTIDVIYPSSPVFLLLAPTTLRDILLPVLDYAQNNTNILYNLPWAPHHLGFWPVCDILPAQQEQMPMEESANLLVMIASILSRTNNSLTWLEPYAGLLDTWGQYLAQSLPDPGNQLCTDDFEGPSPHNTNLALKGIVGLGAYTQILVARGEYDLAQYYSEQMFDFAQYWLVHATDTNLASNVSSTTTTAQTRLQYDLPHTWSLKYNLLYQYILNMKIFPASLMDNEVAFYKTKFNTYGLPLDNRGSLTKTDWASWIAAMSSDAEFSTSVYDFIFNWATTSPDRLPFGDCPDTLTNKDAFSNGAFRARAVQGGIFAKSLLQQVQQQ